MNLAPDGLPISDTSAIDKEIHRLIVNYSSEPGAPDTLTELYRLQRQRREMTTPKFFEEAQALLAKIAAVR
jgi:hypothetical protein